MSKHKKVYNKMNDDYNERVSGMNNQYFNPYLNYPNMYMNNLQNIFRNGVNINNLFDILNGIDINNLASLISDGFDINNFNVGSNVGIFNTNELFINFLNALKPILRIEIKDMIDRFIQFYMDDLNTEK